MKEHVPWFCPVEVGKKADPTGEYVRFVILIPLLLGLYFPRLPACYQRELGNVGSQ